MDHPSSWPLWLRVLGVHQDYLWFVALLLWSLALVVWWWHPRRTTTWRWLPWSATGAILTQIVHFGIFNPPFDFFHDRLRPGTLFDYQTALIDASVLGDLMIGTALAMPAIGWWRSAWRGTARDISRTTTVLAVIALGLLRFVFPALGLAAIGTALWAAGAALRPLTGEDRGARRALISSFILPVFSTVGLLALLSDALLRDGPPTALGALAAVAYSIVGGIVFSALLPGLTATKTVAATSGAGFRRWPVAVGAAIWLVAGIWFAQQTGTDNRFELLQNRLRLTAARAAAFDARFLAGWNAAGLRIGEGGTATVPELERGAGRVLALQLIGERNATIYVDEARLVAVNDGWLVALASNHPKHLPGTVELIRRATPEDVANWNAQANVIETSPAHEIGVPYFCRAPVVAADGSMLAWLEFRRGEFFQSIERKWRTGPLLVTALGLVLGTTLLLQRRSAQEREAALRLAAAQESANQMKSVFLAKVSHELRTPIQSLLGYSELLRREVAGRPIAQSWLDSLQQHGELMTRLVNDLIDLGALDAGTFRLAPRPMRVGEEVCRAVEALRPRADAKGLRLECTSDLAGVDWVSVDPERLRQIVINLVGNAVKFTERGEVRCSLRRATTDNTGTALLEFAVTDTGPGVRPEDQARLFAPFTRLDAASTQEGTGLGLALTAALAKAMGGGATVASDGQTGSRFAATFRATTCAPPVPNQIAAPAELRGFRVLVVDDNPLLRELFVTSLAQAGAVCATAASAAEAELEAKSFAADAAVVDLGLPDDDGANLARRLRASQAHLRIVGVSAHAGSAERYRALAAGMDEFLVKPVSMAKLVATVAAATVGTSEVERRGETSDLRDRLLHEFRLELPEKRAQLRDAVATNQRDAARRLAHYLANSAAAIDDHVLLGRCLALEAACTREADAQELNDLWRACDELLRE